MNNRFSAVNSQNGSIIVVVVMLLAIMSIIGIASTNSTVTESFIVRNVGLRKQNLHLADAVVVEALQQVVDAGLNGDNMLRIDEISPLSATALDWVNDKDVWETDGNLAAWHNPNTTGRILDTSNSAVPESILNGNIEVVNDRGEWSDADNSPIRYAMVGWESVPGSSLKVTAATRRSAHILTEYVSDKFGLIRLDVGVERNF